MRILNNNNKLNNALNEVMGNKKEPPQLVNSAWVAHFKSRLLIFIFIILKKKQKLKDQNKYFWFYFVQKSYWHELLKSKLFKQA